MLRMWRHALSDKVHTDVFSESLAITKPETQPIFSHNRPVADAATDQELQRFDKIWLNQWLL